MLCQLLQDDPHEIRARYLVKSWRTLKMLEIMIDQVLVGISKSGIRLLRARFSTLGGNNE